MGETARRLTLRAGGQAYDVLVGPGLLERSGAAILQAGLRGRPRVVADAAAASHHGHRLRAGLEAAGLQSAWLTLPFNEEAKHLETLSRVYDWLLEVGIERGDSVVAFGGGVCGDLVGFAAATILRGVPLVQVPTTLLAQVDSSIGGKTGVNHPRGKNLIGAFYQPRLVLGDMDTLRTLPKRELAAGWAEVIKIAMVLDERLFGQLEAQTQQLRDLDQTAVTSAIARSIELKGEVAERDERESELRMVLNYGHTVGHALEQATGYRRYLHGEAVAVGMAAAGALSEDLGLLRPADRHRQDSLVRAFGLPLTCSDVALERLWEPMARDKKARASRLTWVLARGVGSYTFRSDVPREAVERALRRITHSTD